MLFWVEECAILYGTFYGPCKADFSPEKDRDGIDSHKSRLGLQPDAPTKGISPVMLIEWYSTTSQLPFHKKYPTLYEMLVSVRNEYVLCTKKKIKHCI